MLKIQECRIKYGIVLRIIKDLPACILPDGEVVHNDKGCCGCRYYNVWITSGFKG